VRRNQRKERDRDAMSAMSDVKSGEIHINLKPPEKIMGIKAKRMKHFKAETT
jgi:hypothetical protein